MCDILEAGSVSILGQRNS